MFNIERVEECANQIENLLKDLKENIEKCKTVKEEIVAGWSAGSMNENEIMKLAEMLKKLACENYSKMDAIREPVNKGSEAAYFGKKAANITTELAVVRAATSAPRKLKI